MARFEQFMANAQTMAQTRFDEALELPYPDAPSPLNISRADICQFYAIGYNQTILKPAYWVGLTDQLDALFSRDPEPELPEAVRRYYQKDLRGLSAAAGKKRPDTCVQSWRAEVMASGAAASPAI